jgi:uncharacterized membrane protein
VGESGRDGQPGRSSPLVRVVPSWTEPAVASASALVGGPLGRHAVVGRSRFWTPLRVLLLIAVAVLAAGWLLRAPCIQQAPDDHGRLSLDWQANRQYVAMCYSDVVTFYGGEHLDGGGLPYLTSWNSGPNVAQRAYNEYPVVAGFFMWETARITRHYEGLTGHASWLPTGLPEAVFFDVTAAFLAAFWLVVVWLVRKARSWRPWDAALVALSPLAFLHVFTGLDALAVAAATGGLYLFGRGRAVPGGVLLGLAAATKAYAGLLLVPVLLLEYLRRSRDAPPGESGQLGAARLTGAAVLTWLVVNVPVAVGLTPGWLEYFKDSVSEAPGPDSLYNVLSFFTGWPTFAPHRTPGVLNLVVLGLLAVAVLALGVLVRMAPRPPRLASLCFLLVAAALLVNKTWSPQFSLWLVPLAVLALPRWRLLMTWMTLDALIWVPRMFYYLGVDDKGLPAGPFLGVVLLRDAMVVLLMVLVVRTVLHPETDPLRMPSPAGDRDDPDLPARPIRSALVTASSEP